MQKNLENEATHNPSQMNKKELMSYLRSYLDENQKLESVLQAYLDQNRESTAFSEQSSIDDIKQKSLMEEIEKRKQTLNNL